MDSLQEKALRWTQGLREAIIEKSQNNGHKYRPPDNFVETQVKNLQQGNVIKLNNRLNLIEAIQINKGIHTLIVIHRNKRDARSFFASETVLRKVQSS